MRSVRLPLMLEALVLLGGCIHASPVPVVLDTRVAEAASIGLDPRQVAQLASALAPAAVRTDRPDRLSLLAALLIHDPRIAQARKALIVAQREAASARKVGAPGFTLTGQYSNDPTTEPWQAGIGASLPLDYGGQKAARLTRADVAALIARDDLAETIWAERMAAHAALIDLEAARLREPVLAAQAQIRAQILTAVDVRLKAGEGAALERDTALLAARQAARALEDNRGAQRNAAYRLAATIGVPMSSLDGFTLTWDDFAAPAPAAPLPTGPADDQALRRAATVSRADVLRAVLAYDQSEADLRGELARQAPKFNLQPALTWAGGPVTVPFGLGLSLPSWDGNRAAIRLALARREAASAAITTAISAALGAIDTAAQEAQAARAALAHLRNAEWGAAQAAGRRTLARLASGEIARIEALTQQAAILDTQAALIDAIARVQRADAALEDAMRRPLSGPETQINVLALANASAAEKK